MGRRFLGYVEEFTPHFRLGNHRLIQKAATYLQGLMQAHRKNMERMVEVVPDSKYQSLHHFTSCSPWDAQAVMDQVATRADGYLGDEREACLLLDESSFEKKGKESVGVARQWSGRAGKVDNCQVAVFASLCNGDHAALVDTRLYLPEKWVLDPERCEKAQIPKEHAVLRSKVDLGLEMVVHARELGLRFGWVGADGGYGKDPGFLRRLAASGESFVADVHKSQRVYQADPEPFIPEPSSSRGRRPSRRVSQEESLPVEELVKRQSRSAWKRAHLRKSTKGTLRVEVFHQHVWVWDGEEQEAHQWHLVATREIGSKKEDIKYSLSNMPLDTPPARLARMQRQRYWIERAFQDGKSECGMADYQTRGWVAWHHHMALVMMAMQFMLEERILQKEQTPLLSCSDIEALLAHFLPRRDVSVGEVIRQMEVRHQQRQESIDSAYEAQMRRKILEDKGLDLDGPT